MCRSHPLPLRPKESPTGGLPKMCLSWSPQIIPVVVSPYTQQDSENDPFMWLSKPAHVLEEGGSRDTKDLVSTTVGRLGRLGLWYQVFCWIALGPRLEGLGSLRPWLVDEVLPGKVDEVVSGTSGASLGVRKRYWHTFLRSRCSRPSIHLPPGSMVLNTTQSPGLSFISLLLLHVAQYSKMCMVSVRSKKVFGRFRSDRVEIGCVRRLWMWGCWLEKGTPFNNSLLQIFKTPIKGLRAVSPLGSGPSVSLANIEPRWFPHV